MMGCSINRQLILRITAVAVSASLSMETGQPLTGPRPAEASAPSSGILPEPAAPDGLDADHKSVDARSLPSGHCRVTNSQLSAVKHGANYADVVHVFGCAGTLTSSEMIEGTKFQLFAWNDGQVLSLFANGKLLIALRSAPS